MTFFLLILAALILVSDRTNLVMGAFTNPCLAVVAVLQNEVGSIPERKTYRMSQRQGTRLIFRPSRMAPAHLDLGLNSWT
mmetsp:Transcript_13626/g.27901  ORF Transcript_13626/g.27901 Transcript_13626/m.27901 type:complete len:80 (+) Transcript_13626:1820-2059(+)